MDELNARFPASGFTHRPTSGRFKGENGLFRAVFVVVLGGKGSKMVVCTRFECLYGLGPGGWGAGGMGRASPPFSQIAGLLTCLEDSFTPTSTPFEA